ncbi:hypothetical protein AB0395_18890 [Streptosporangium sp. NPDC051023]|uniref:hypothetical protein n=1 Tax=Streptosporangium sp. NPDC051023 TaxID=3155410 RepID=UPI00344EC7C8
MSRTIVLRLLASLPLLAGGAGTVWGAAFTVSGIVQGRHVVAVYVDPIPHKLPLSVSTATDMSTGPMFKPPNILMATHPTLAETVLSHGGALLDGLCAGLAGLLLHRLFRSVLHGRPAHRRNAARLAWLAVLSLVVGVAGPIIPFLASSMVLDRVKLADACTPAALYSRLSMIFVLGAILLFVLAEICRSRAESDESRPLGHAT